MDLSRFGDQIYLRRGNCHGQTVWPGSSVTGQSMRIVRKGSWVQVPIGLFADI